MDENKKRTFFEALGKFNDYTSNNKEWDQKRRERQKMDNFRCVICKSSEKLVCHHLAYLRLYNEKITDLITLCSRCHSWIHIMCPPKNIPDFVRGEGYLVEGVTAPTEEEMIKAMWGDDDTEY